MGEDQDHIDRISDILKASTLRKHQLGTQLDEVEVAALFINEPGGPQFFIGDRGRAQPLYFTPAHDGQRPVAWMARRHGCLITQDRDPYREDIDWTPLYLAR